jgi:hypothetical protein
MDGVVFCLAALLAVAAPETARAQPVVVPAQPGYAMNPPPSDSPLQQQLLRNYRSDLQQAQREMTVQYPAGLTREQLDVARQLNAVNSMLNPAPLADTRLPPTTMAPAMPPGASVPAPYQLR